MDRKLILGVVIAIAFTSCTQEDVLKTEFGLKTLNATIESEKIDSRVGFTDETNAQFFWTKGDQIGVTTSSSNTLLLMTLNDADKGKSSGSFTGHISSIPSGYAVYPYYAKDDGFSFHTINENNELSYHLRASYSYSNLDSEYANDGGNSHDAPMWGSISNGTVTFKHLGGVIVFEVNGLPESTANMKFKLTATNKINGSFPAALTSQEPKIVSEATTVESEKTVEITFSTLSSQTKGYFYVPVPTGNLGNLTAVVLKEDNSSTGLMGAWDNISIARKDIRRAVIGNQSIVGGDGEIKQVASVSEVNEALTTNEENLTVKVSNQVTGNHTITIPASLDTQTTTFSFTSFADDSKITITEATSGNYNGQIIIEVPEGETIPEVEATVPNGEVYIKQGNVTTLVTSAAPTTTIIGAKATIGTLEVIQGNVRLEAGATVDKIINRSDETIYVIFEAATKPVINIDQEGNEVVFMSAAEWDLRKAIEQGGEYTLKSDVTLSSTLYIDNTIILNLGGYTLTNMVDNESTDVIMVNENGKLTINGEGNVTAVTGNDGFTIISKGTLTINGGTFSSGLDTTNDGNCVIYARGNGKVYINGGTFLTSEEDDTKYLINKRDDDRATTTIEVKGGRFQNFDPANNQAEGPNTNFVVSGYSSVLNNDGYYEVSQGILNETALRAAVAVGGEITLDTSITLSSTLYIDNTVILNLGGYTLTNMVDNESTDVIMVNENGKLTINGEGNVTAVTGNDGFTIISKGTLTINGGTFSSGLDTTNDGNCVIYARGNGKVYINGGTFLTSEEDDTKYLINKRDDDRATTTIEVKGGRFQNFDPANNQAEGPNTNFVVSGYSSVLNDDGYYVVSESLN